MPLEKLGPYRLERLLGRGGMGSVYVGHNEATGEQAAVKVLSGHLADDAAFRERFKQEVETLKRLLHPNIVQLMGYGEEDGYLFYVMELVQGRSLQEELVAGRPFSWREVTRLGIAIAHALKHAHDRGIIHRDLKPANLLIDAQEHVKLADFGIAKLYGGSNVTVAGGVLGTADYMAPEQAEGKGISGRSDLYALGSVLYALLTGKPPFACRTVLDVMNALKTEKPIPVRRLAPDTPEEFEHIILQLLEKDPEQRIPTALALANRLKAMEHALSLETRILNPAAEAIEAIPEPSAEPRSWSAKTSAGHPSAQPTRSTKITDDNQDYRLIHNAPTEAVGNIASSRTSLGTQAGQGTGAGSDNGRGTDSVREAGDSGRGSPGNSALADASADLPAKATRFTPVSETELRGERLEDEGGLRQWGIFGGLLAVAAAVIAAVMVYAVRPPSADRLYGIVKQATERGGVDELVAVESELARFGELYPDDPRAGELQEYRDELERYRLQRRIEVRARRGGDVLDLTPVERAYQNAARLSATDPAAALAKFEALVAVYGKAFDPAWTAAQKRAAKECLNLARGEVERLRPAVEKMNAEERKMVDGQLVRADELSKTDRAAAEAIWRGIVTLFGEKEWARDAVEKARAKLAAQ